MCVLLRISLCLRVVCDRTAKFDLRVMHVEFIIQVCLKDIEMKRTFTISVANYSDMIYLYLSTFTDEFALKESTFLYTPCTCIFIFS